MGLGRMPNLVGPNFYYGYASRYEFDYCRPHEISVVRGLNPTVVPRLFWCFLHQMTENATDVFSSDDVHGVYGTI